MIEQTCICCKKKFKAREADVKRGWAKNCSKSCAASSTNKKTGNYSRFKESQRKATSKDDGEGFSVFGESWDDHKFY